VKSLSIQSKILFLALGSVLTTAITLLIVVGWSAGHLRAELRNQVGSMADTSTNGQAQSLYELCVAFDVRTKRQLQYSTGA